MLALILMCENGCRGQNYESTATTVEPRPDKCNSFTTMHMHKVTNGNPTSENPSRADWTWLKDNARYNGNKDRGRFVLPNRSNEEGKEMRGTWTGLFWERRQGSTLTHQTAITAITERHTHQRPLFCWPVSRLRRIMHARRGRIEVVGLTHHDQA